jgi:hypothetical protein
MQIQHQKNDKLYLHSRIFDAFFIFGILFLALALGALASVSAVMLLAVVYLNIWCFANPHIFATYTRISTNKNFARNHWFLIFFLPIIVLIGLTATALAYEISGLFTLYIFAQTYHVSRQSYGIARTYRRIDPTRLQNDRLPEALIYLLPAWGLLNWCSQSTTSFLTYPIFLPAISPVWSNIVGFLTAGAVAFWLLRQYRLADTNSINHRHDWFVASHIGIFFVAYIWISDITLGWLIVNIWHNVQYLLFVWWKNTKNVAYTSSAIFCPQADDTSFPWSNAAQYFALCAVLGGLLYVLFDFAGQKMLWLGLPTVLIMHFTLNFHHYLVDGVIWKRPKPMQKISSI